MSARNSTILITILALALLGLAIFTVAKTSDLNSQASELRSDLSDLEATANSLEDQTESGGKDAAAEIADLSRSLKKLRACLPELQNEITGLGVELEGSYSEGFYAYIENNSQVSSYCQPVVYPDVSAGGE